MRVIAHDDIAEFTETVVPWLEREPVHHNLITTILTSRVGARTPPEEGMLLWRVVDGEGATVGVAVMTPPLPMVLTGMPPQAQEALAGAAKAHGVNRFTGPGSGRLAELVSPGTCRRVRGSGLFRLAKVAPPPPAPGSARLAAPEDLASVWAMVRGFQEELADPVPLEPSQVEARIEGEQIWLWERDGEPVAMAAWTPPVSGVVRINLVFTPPELRGLGYAGNLVAAVAQAVLDRGHVPILYTDLANPTSNKIYQAVGFEKLDEPEEWHAVHPVPEAAPERPPGR